LKFVTTTAIILRQINFSDSDKIFSLLTPDLGRVSAIAKGVRKIKSRKAGHLDLGNVVKVSLAEGKNIYILTQAELVVSPPKNQLSVMAIIFETLETLGKLLHDGQDAAVFYPLYITFLQGVKINHMVDFYLEDFYRGIFKLSGFWQESLITYSLSQLRSYFENVVETHINSRYLAG